MSSKTHQRLARTLTEAEKRTITRSLFNHAQEHAKRTNYCDLAPEQLASHVESVILPAIQARQIDLEGDILARTDFEAGVRESYTIAYNGTVVGERLLISTESKPPHGKRQLPHLNFLTVYLDGIHTLNGETRERLRQEAQFWFMSSVQDQATRFIIQVYPILGYRAYPHIDEACASLRSQFPSIRVHIKLDHQAPRADAETSVPTNPYRATVNLEDREDEIPFFTLAELLLIIAEEQAQRRRVQGEPLQHVQVNICDAREDSLLWYEQITHHIHYNVEGNQLTGIWVGSDMLDSAILATFGLPTSQE